MVVICGTLTLQSGMLPLDHRINDSNSSQITGISF